MRSFAKQAIGSGLEVSPEHAEILDHIQDADIAIEARYIVTGFKEVPTDEALSSVVAALDKSICLALGKAGHPVREEAFVRPTLSRVETGLGDETICVLIHLFKTPDRLDRHVGAMASALKLEDSVVQYHVDLLVAAKLVERTGGNARFGVVDWSLTPAARQYVVERDLNR